MESEGIGVTSSMRPILMPPRASALSADCAPGPGVFVRLPPCEVRGSGLSARRTGGGRRRARAGADRCRVRWG